MRKCRQSCCVGAFIWLVTLSLAALLCIQIVITIFIVLGSPLPLPKNQITAWINQAIDPNYVVSIDRIRVDRNAVVRVEGLAIRERRGNLPVLSADVLNVDFFAPGIVLGQIRPEQVSLRGLVLYEHIEHLDQPDPIMRIPSLRLQSTRNAWRIENAFASVSGITLIGSGIIDPANLRELFPSESAAVPADPPIPRIHRLITDSVRTLDTVTRDFAETSVFFELRPGSFQRKEIRWHLAIPSATPLPGVRFHDSRITGRTLIAPDSIESTLSGRILEVLSDDVSIHEADWRFQVGFHPGAEDPVVITGMEIAADRIRVAGEAISSLIVDMNDPVSGQVQAIGSLFYRNTPVEFSTDIDTDTLSGIIAIKTRIDPFEVIGSFPEIRDQLREVLVLPDPVDLQATAFLRPGGIPDSVGFFLDSGKIDVLGMDGERLVASGRLFQDGLQIRRFNFDTQRYSLEGNFSVDFENSDWRVSFTGGAIPRELSGWFEPWWDNLWKRFDFSRPPTVDFRIRGNATARQDRDIFGEIRLPPTIISDFPIHRATATVWGDERYLSIQIRDAAAPAGDLSGYLHYFYNHRRNLLVARAYDFITNIRLPDEFKVMGEDIARLLDNFETTGPVDLFVRGVVVDREARESLRRHETLHIRAQTEFPVTTAGITLDDLGFRATYAHHKAQVRGIEFGLGGGRGQGWLDWRGKPDSNLDLQFRVDNADPRAALRAVAILRDADALTTSGEESSDRKSRRLDMFADLSGDPDAPFDFVGEIIASVHSPDLGEIRVLGILSRLFAAAPPPFNIGSIRFNQLEITANLKDGQLNFSRFDLYSTTSRIKATGRYFLKSGIVDMQLRVFLFQEISTPIIGWAAQIFKPLARILVFNLGGTVSAESVDLRLNPGESIEGNSRSRR